MKTKKSVPSIQANGRRVSTVGDTQLIQNVAQAYRRVLIGTPTLGVIRMEFSIARRAIVIPINWSNGEIISGHLPESIVAQGYTTADAQNVILEAFIQGNFQWLFLLEDDTLPPADVFIKLEQYMVKGEVPIVSGLYYSKGNPSWPLVFRGRGNGAFTKFTIGDKVWADGFPTGCILFHRSILEWFWKNTPKYQMPDGRKIPQVFKFPRDAWYDPEKDQYFSHMGTSDLFLADRIMKEQVLEKTGWAKLAKQRYPFLIDTSIFCRHITLEGLTYPDHAEVLG